LSPDTLDAEITAGTRTDRERLALELRFRAGGPVRHAHPDCEARRAHRVHAKLQRLFLRKARVEREAHAALRPGELGGHEEIHVQAGSVVEIDAVAELGEGFGHAASAAPEVLE